VPAITRVFLEPEEEVLVLEGVIAADVLNMIILD